MIRMCVCVFFNKLIKITRKFRKVIILWYRVEEFFKREEGSI